MKVNDYIHLSIIGIRKNRKKYILSAIIISLIPSVLMTAALLLQGFENIAYEKMLATTKGKVLIKSDVDKHICNGNNGKCDYEVERKAILSNIKKYHGKVIDSRILRNEDGIFYQISDPIFNQKPTDESSNVVQIVAPIAIVSRLLNTELSTDKTNPNETIRQIKELGNRSHNQIVAGREKIRYSVAAILPDGYYSPSLSIPGASSFYNPLDPILNQIITGHSENFIVDNNFGQKNHDIDFTSNLEYGSFMKSSEKGPIFALFNTPEDANNYFQDKQNYCKENDRIYGLCGEFYKYEVSSAISDPLTTYQNFRKIWFVYGIIVVISLAIVIFLSFIILSRIIDNESQIISVYQTVGATNRQIKTVYFIRFIVLILVSIIVSSLISCCLLIIYNCIYMQSIQQALSIAFSIVSKEEPIIGWNNIILQIAIGMLIIPVTYYLFCNIKHSHKNNKISQR